MSAHRIERNEHPRAPQVPHFLAPSRRQHQALLWQLHARLAHRTGQPAEEIAEDMRRGRYLDAREALDYGLVDEIGTAR